MPHIVVRRFNAVQTPFEEGGVKFLFFSVADGDGIAGAEAFKCRFLLRYTRRGDKAILKVDKATRPPFLEIVKRALIAFASAGGATIVAKNFDEIKQTAPSDRFYEPNEFISNYDRSKKLWIEVGFGSGRHILQNAKSFADKLHLGAEIHRPSAERLLKRAKAEGVNNIAALLCDAKMLLAALPPNSSERVFVHFPVPWDKSPSRRVFCEPFVSEALRVLTKDGVLHLRADDESYFTTALEIAQKFQNVTIETKIDEEAITRSKYEDRWRRMHKTIFDLFVIKRRERQTETIEYCFDFPDGAAKNSVALGLIAISERFLLRVNERRQLANGGFLMRLIMGDPLALQTLYLLQRTNRLCYFPSAPLPTRANFLAHRALIEALYG
ncbi:MAG: tRNA (guanosine(46)-N7)-methyltransferase TrmB [Helicobacteraceae bacterium]|jgi:tRNA (guanine-N7-)-methyltransferase|nr:tRNA (guanosine(46)-N7)-methyltransferase TrmB [Helicobacteraceae bacterium]